MRIARIWARACPTLAALVVLLSGLVTYGQKQQQQQQQQAIQPAISQANCGKAPLFREKDITGYIINGAGVRYGRFPSYARLFMNTNWMCGGTLVSDRHIITAAHCVKLNQGRGPGEYRPEAIDVILGERDLTRRDEHESQHRVARICAAPNYSNNRTDILNDWALITLSQPVKFNDWIQPACLPYNRTRAPHTQAPRARCWVVGAGVSGFTNGGIFGGRRPQFPDHLQALRLKEISCQAWRHRYLHPSRVCYTRDSRNNAPGDSCQGDSGGPVLCKDPDNRWTLVAAVSSGTDDCNTRPFGVRLPGVYTNIVNLLPEIQYRCLR